MIRLYTDRTASHGQIGAIIGVNRFVYTDGLDQIDELVMDRLFSPINWSLAE